MIPPNILMVQDVRKCYNYKIGSIGDMEIREAYDRLFDNGILKEEFKIVERKGLTQSLDFLNVFKTEWIGICLVEFMMVHYGWKMDLSKLLRE